MEKLRQRPRLRVARQIARRAGAVLNQEQRALIHEKVAERHKDEALATEQRKLDREAARRVVSDARDELAARKKSARQSAREAKRQHLRDSTKEPTISVAMFDAYQAGELTHVIRAPHTPGNPSPVPIVTRLPLDSPQRTIGTALFCEIMRILNVPLPAILVKKCAEAQAHITHASPWRAVGWDRPPDWPPGAPSMAPWLVSRASRVLTALPRLLLHSEALDPAHEAEILAQGLAALRLLAEAGIGDTFQRLAPYLPELLARNHDGWTPGTPPGCTQPCHDTGCSAPIPECLDLRAVPLAVYLHHVAPTLGERIDARLATFTGEPLDELRAELYTTFAEEAWTLANAGTFPFRYDWPPELAVCWALAHYNQWPPPTATQAQLAHFLEHAARAAALVAPRWPTLDALKHAALAADLTLAPGLITH